MLRSILSNTGSSVANLGFVQWVRRLFKPRIQNKLILAFLLIGLVPMIVAAVFVVEINSYRLEREIEIKIKQATARTTEVISNYEQEAQIIGEELLARPELKATLVQQQSATLLTLPETSGPYKPYSLWMPGRLKGIGYGDERPGPDGPRASQGIRTLTKVDIEMGNQRLNTILAGVIIPVWGEEEVLGNLAVGYELGKSFAQDLEIKTGVVVRVYHEKSSNVPPPIFFEQDDVTVPESAKKEIERIAVILAENENAKIVIEGHTDSLGSPRLNYRLAARRAEAVRELLVSHGISAMRISAVSFGQSRPIGSNNLPEGRARNRRVEFEFIVPEEERIGSVADLPLTSEVHKSLFEDKVFYYDKDALYQGNYYRALYLPLVGTTQKVLGFIFLGLPKRYTFNVTVWTWSFFPILLGIGAIVSISLGYTMARRIARPIRFFSRGVLAVADGDLDQQLPVKDKDEIGQLSEAFNVLTKRLRQLREFEKESRRKDRLAALGELSAGVAHEIRNPLGIIKNSAQMLQTNLQDEGRCKELSSFIVDEVNRLNKVITNFLEFARPLEPDFEMIDINRVLKRTVSLIESEAAKNNVRLVTNLQDDLPQVMVDREQCHQAFLNLLINSIQAMEAGGELTVCSRNGQPELARIVLTKGESTEALSEKRTVVESADLSQDSAQEFVEVTFSDTGMGIPGENLDKVFNPFFSTKEGGIGLGLSLVHKIVESHHGHLFVSSKVGEGTTFTIRLPLHGQLSDEDEP